VPPSIGMDVDDTARVFTTLRRMRKLLLVSCLVALPPSTAGAQVGAASETTACPSAGAGTEVRLDSTGAVSRARSDTSTRRDSAQTFARSAVILRASVSAREVRFASAPHVTVRMCGGTLDSVRVLERRNLPSPVVAGTTYRDVFVSIELLGHLTADCIASGLTGASVTGGRSVPCASIGIRDSASVRTPPTTRPPP
jgi:hypothetical protein